MIFRKLQLILVLGLSGLVLFGCGDSDTDSSSSDKSQSTLQTTTESTVEVASDGVVAAYDPDVPSMMVEDNGVVSEEEIYKNWPAEVATTSGESASTEAAVETITAGSATAKTHTVYGRATSFSPNILFINPGDTVQWENMTIHDSVSMEGLIPEGAEPWVFKLGQNGAVTLTEEGVYIYKCNPHYPLGMVAAIIVGKPVNIEQIQANATGRSKGIVIKVVKALATQ
jgi:pseudoazurin